MKNKIWWISLIIFLSMSGFASAEDGINSGDTAWVLTSAALVLLMTPAVGFFYGGMVRKKHVLTIITQTIVIMAVVSLLWVLVGYSLSFGPDVGGKGLIGSLDFFALNGVGMLPDPIYSATIPALAFMLFQMMFAIITPALIIGGFADRMKFSAFIAFIAGWSVLVYSPIAHWVWGNGGWIRNLGVLDFAGGTVVHISAGVSALAAALIIKRRIGIKDGNAVKPHDITMVILGAALLWFGWFGFNAGSALSAGGLASHAFVVTNTAAAAAALSWMTISWIHTKKPSSMGIVIGAVCGLVAITPACGFVSVPASILIGLIAGLVCYTAVWFMKTKTKIDDALDVFACHGVGGITGALLTGIFASKLINPAGADGLLAGNFALFSNQLMAVLVVAAFSFVATVIILKLIDWTIGIRVHHKEELLGLDLAHHGEEAYHHGEAVKKKR